jgi:hypothetical protein
MKVEITLKEAYARASKGLRHKMAYSIRLLQKAEKLALAYDNRGGITWLSAGEKTLRPSIISLNWQAYNSRDT